MYIGDVKSTVAALALLYKPEKDNLSPEQKEVLEKFALSLKDKSTTQELLSDANKILKTIRSNIRSSDKKRKTAVRNRRKSQSNNKKG